MDHGYTDLVATVGKYKSLHGKRATVRSPLQCGELSGEGSAELPLSSPCSDLKSVKLDHLPLQTATRGHPESPLLCPFLREVSPTGWILGLQMLSGPGSH